MSEDEARRLAGEHWEWLGSLIIELTQYFGVKYEEGLHVLIRKVFTDAFIHGYKHGKEDKHE